MCPGAFLSAPLSVLPWDLSGLIILIPFTEALCPDLSLPGSEDFFLIIRPGSVYNPSFSSKAAIEQPKLLRYSFRLKIMNRLMAFSTAILKESPLCALLLFHLIGTTVSGVERVI